MSYGPMSLYHQAVQRQNSALACMQAQELSLRRDFFVQHGQHLPWWPVVYALDDFPAPTERTLPAFDADLPPLTPGWSL